MSTQPDQLRGRMNSKPRWQSDYTPPEMTRRRLTASQQKPIPLRGYRPKRPPVWRRFTVLLLILVAMMLVGWGLKALIDYWPPFFTFHREYGTAPLKDFIPPAQVTTPRAEPVAESTVVHRVRSGDTLIEIGKRYGFSGEALSAIDAAIGSIETKDEDARSPLKQGRSLLFDLNPQGELVGIRAPLPTGSELHVLRKDDGSFTARIDESTRSTNELVAIGTITSSFAAAATKAGAPYDIVDDLVDLFSDRIEFNKDFRVGDRFTLIYKDHMVKDGKTISPGPILAAALEIGGEHLVAARYVGSDGKARYFDEKGKLLGNAILRYPLKFSRISSYFSTSRFHPVLKFARPHNGVDFAAPIGTPVRAVADGHVLFAGRNGGSGIVVKLRHSARYATAYLHLNSIASGVSNGARVRRGQVIGAVGMTGLATGPHLHFSFYDNGKYIDPLKTKLPMLDSLEPGTSIDKHYLRRVLFTIDHYQTLNLHGFFSAKEE